MKDKQWVQHVSGQGEKWEVVKDYEEEWAVLKKVNQPSFLYLPKSEFRLTDPPEQWVDVTEECEIDRDGWIVHQGLRVKYFNNYRVRKIAISEVVGDPLLLSSYSNRPAFVIEKEVPAS